MPVITLLCQHIVNHAHGHIRQSFIRQIQLGASEHKYRAIWLPGRRSQFFAGTLVVWLVTRHSSSTAGRTS